MVTVSLGVIMKHDLQACVICWNITMVALALISFTVYGRWNPIGWLFLLLSVLGLAFWSKYVRR